jgi:hypothetical protein
MEPSYGGKQRPQPCPPRHTAREALRSGRVCPGHNYPSYMPDMYHPHNAQGPMPTPMVPSRSGAPGWAHMPLPQHEFMMAANTMEDKVNFALRGMAGTASGSRLLHGRSLGVIYLRWETLDTSHRERVSRGIA